MRKLKNNNIIYTRWQTMRVELTHRLTLTAKEAMVSPKSKLVEAKLKELYENRCINKMYVTKVLAILELGDCCACKDVGNGDFFMDVEFAIEGIQYVDGVDVIMGLTLKHKNNDIITMENAHVICTIEEPQLSKMLVVGDSFPVVVLKSTYPYRQPKMTIVGKFYKPVPNNLSYKVTDATEPVDPKLIEDMNLMHKWIPTIDVKVLDRYDMLLYPYKTVIKGDPTKKISELLDKPQLGFIMRPSYISKLRPLVVHHPASKDMENVPFIETTFKVAMESIIIEHIKMLEFTKALIETYGPVNSPKDRIGLVWSFIVSNKPTAI
jgi:hypothetical protein